MTHDLQQDPRAYIALGRRALAAAIDALGEEEFPEVFGKALASIAPVTLFSVFRLDETGCPAYLLAGGQVQGDGEFAEIASRRYADGYWKTDPVMHRVREDCGRELAIHSQSWDAIPPSEYRTFCYERVEVRERVMVCRRFATESLLLGLYRTSDDDCFQPAHLTRLENLAEMLVSIAWKHAQVAPRQPPEDRSRLSLRPGEDSVARHLAQCNGKLSSREIAVCTGLLLGRSTKEIARSLGVKPTSVVTFKKRAFLKLRVATQQELIRHYERSLDA